jgi:hypothetical protein
VSQLIKLRKIRETFRQDFGFDKNKKFLFLIQPVHWAAFFRLRGNVLNSSTIPNGTSFAYFLSKHRFMD